MTSRQHSRTRLTRQLKGPPPARRWALGDYPAVAYPRHRPPLGPRLVGDAVLPLAAGERVLDVAAGVGNAAIPAACSRCPVVTASDLDAGAARDRRHVTHDVTGSSMDWQVDRRRGAAVRVMSSFDVALSCVGVMFAPHHQLSADELDPGGYVLAARSA